MKGILFKTEMVQANAAGRKNQTRRVINPQPSGFIDDPHFEWLVPLKGAYKNGVPLGQPKGGLTPAIKCPYGQPGDILFTRETWMHAPNGHFKHMPKFEYKATACQQFIDEWPNFWKPAIHMPTVAARYFHRITSIRAERIMDITPQDCINEGIEVKETIGPAKFFKVYGMDGVGTVDPIKSYKSLWQLINGKPKPIQKKVAGKLITTGYIVYPWGDPDTTFEWIRINGYRGKPLTVVPNPWVWRIEYENIEKPIIK